LAKVLPPTLETVVTGGNVLIDGAWKTAHLGIRTDGSMEVLQNVPTGIPVTDIKGKYVSPGFIDILADNAANPERTYRIFEKYKVTDGVTTALQMHGGSAKVAEYYKHFGSLPHRINFGVSVFVMRIRYAKPTLGERLKLEHWVSLIVLSTNRRRMKRCFNMPDWLKNMIVLFFFTFGTHPSRKNLKELMRLLQLLKILVQGFTSITFTLPAELFIWLPLSQK